MGHSKKLLEDGYIIFKNVYSDDFINNIKSACKNVENKYFELGGERTKDGIVISHPFKYDPIFLDIISNEMICQTIENAIGDKITLTNSNINNRQIKDSHSKEKPPGSTWHTDSRYVQEGRVKLSYGSGYLAVLCIDNFSIKNGSTQYVPKSHIFRDKPAREISSKDYQIKNIELNSGDMFIFDSGLWHKAGESSLESRWGVFNFYSPWYIKPYYRFDKMFKTSEILLMNNRLIDLFHFSSTPPSSQLERQNTVITAEEFKKNFK